MILNIICITLVSLGILFFIGGALGILRFPDYYTRMHAAGKGDTMSILLIFGGIALYQMHEVTVANALVAGKILFIAAFIMLTSPTSTHALMRAGYEEGIRPWTRKTKKGQSDS
ncbi:MAG: monovalent cation/H(+) antiporter subunit G [Opitutaceae bacterium]|nr:monovalent cation/H(+) antiporter subunit G [Opitutaceae bacterium]